MSDIGQKRPMPVNQKTVPKARKGRPKKKPDYDKKKTIEELLLKATSLFGEPYDDRGFRSPDAPTIASVAEQMGTTAVRVRKLLITADFFSTSVSRKVIELHRAGFTMKQIMEKTGLGEASVYSYLPYSKGVYNLEDATLSAEQGRQFRLRRNTCDELVLHIDGDEADAYLLKTIEVFENYTFRDMEGLPLRYTIKDNSLCFNRNDGRISMEEVFDYFHELKNKKESGKQLTPGASYLFAIFLRFGLIESE